MTDAEFEQELVEALNMLLEDERASVEMEVALASGATEYRERDELAKMGAQDIHFCEQLRGEMELAGLPVTPQINGVVFQVIGAERYDDRLRAFAHHQRAVAERARELQESNLEGELRAALEDISRSHDDHAGWIEQRAADFAATRTLEFGPAQRGGPDAPSEARGTGDESLAPADAVEALETVEPEPQIVAVVESAEPVDVVEAVEEVEPLRDVVAEPVGEGVAEERAAIAPRKRAPRATSTAKPVTKPATKPAAKSGAKTPRTATTRAKAPAKPKATTPRARRTPSDTTSEA